MLSGRYGKLVIKYQLKLISQCYLGIGAELLWFYDFDSFNLFRFLDEIFIKRSKACGF
jgi:hypothetical protein